MAIVNDHAVVLRVWEYSESSQIVSLFTAAHGRVRLLGKGLRRSTKQRFAPGLDALERGEAAMRLPQDGVELGALTEWRQQEFYPALRSDLARLYAGFYAIELIPALTEDRDPHPRIFDALVALLHDLDREEDANARLAAAVVRFQAELLRAIGYAPNLRVCGVCGRPRGRRRPMWFSAGAGGIVCGGCAANQPERLAWPAALRVEHGTPAEARLWFPLLDYYLSYIGGRRFRSAARLRRAIDPQAQTPESAIPHAGRTL